MSRRSIVESRIKITSHLTPSSPTVLFSTHVVRYSPQLQQSHLDNVDALADVVSSGALDFRCERCKSSAQSSSFDGGASRYASVVASRRGSFDDAPSQRGSDADAKRFFGRRAYDIVTDVDPTRAMAALERIVDEPLPWRRPHLVLAGALVSFVAPLFWFGSGFVDAIIAASLGGVVVALGFLADDFERVLSHVYPMFAAFLCGFVAMYECRPSVFRVRVRVR